MFQPLDGPSKQYKLTVTDSTVLKIEASSGAGAYEERKVVTLQPNGKIKVYFGESSVPSSGTVASDGFTHFKNQKDSYEAGEQQDMYILADSGSVDVIVVERA